MEGGEVFQVNGQVEGRKPPGVARQGGTQIDPLSVHLGQKEVSVSVRDSSQEGEQLYAYVPVTAALCLCCPQPPAALTGEHLYQHLPLYTSYECTY